MAEEHNPAFDPDATVSQPLTEPDPEATVSLPAAGLLAEPDAEATDRLPVFDPDATFNPADRVTLDPDATVRIASPGRVQRHNPFAPLARAESLQTSLTSLGGVNSLVAMANPILGAVPQIRRTLRHPDPVRLKETLKDQIEGFEMSASSADVPDAIKDSAVYALCALLDESAAATPWGTDWVGQGLLREMRGASGAAEGFFDLLDRTLAEAETSGDENIGDLLEVLYICLALGFEGKYRGSDEGRQALRGIQHRLYALISRRHPRPIEGLSERWRTPAAQALVDEALATAARASASRAAAEAAAKLAPAPAAPLPLLKRLPRRAIWSALAGLVGAVVVFYMLALRLLEDDEKAALASRPAARVKAKSVTAPAPEAPAVSPAARLSAALSGEPVSLAEASGEMRIALRHDRQFAPGGIQPAPELQPVLRKIAQALEGVPGAVVVTGHSDATPVRAKGGATGSNQALSVARAESVAKLLGAQLSDPKRIRVEGKGDASPVAGGETPESRAKNRRVEILLKAP